MLFAGVFVAGNLQTPRLPHTPFDASIDFLPSRFQAQERRV